ncbi:c-type cytochrome [Stutzerimonas azotifigens]|uniref:Cytochrome c n=1 Tax=Stutzerimonas azotifigens TaxID=291995 RepID=A0ABR5YZ63_9GAMM|nr:cytochrome c [Stutzerimonas azotifigens]MBA1273212.1 cytochrome c [Stutzerimonas azotifigens]
MTRSGLRRFGVLVLAMAFVGGGVQAADRSAGKAKARVCVACHGLDGLSKLPDAPNLAGNSELYLRTQLTAYRAGERQHPQMSIIAKGLSDEDIADLTAWYSAIKVTVELPE